MLVVLAVADVIPAAVPPFILPEILMVGVDVISIPLFLPPVIEPVTVSEVPENLITIPSPVVFIPPITFPFIINVPVFCTIADTDPPGCTALVPTKFPFTSILPAVEFIVLAPLLAVPTLVLIVPLIYKVPVEDLFIQRAEAFGPALKLLPVMIRLQLPL